MVHIVNYCDGVVHNVLQTKMDIKGKLRISRQYFMSQYRNLCAVLTEWMKTDNYLIIDAVHILESLLFPIVRPK